ncbi:MAG: citrate/2-methylcitrate synthase, partial [Gammaproteobacteria bacterium]
MSKHTVSIVDNDSDRSIECPVYRGTAGAPVIDTRNLYKELGMFTFDPGYLTTASCRSAITYLDGENGILMHRGYPIEQLAKHGSYLEVCYLLIHGELPKRAEIQQFESAVKEQCMVHEHLIKFYGGYRYDAHPMSIMVGVTGAMASYYHEVIDIFDQEHRQLTAQMVIGKMPNIASKCYK